MNRTRPKSPSEFLERFDERRNGVNYFHSPLSLRGRLAQQDGARRRRIMQRRSLITISIVATAIASVLLPVGCARVPPLNHVLISTTEPSTPSPIRLQPNDRGYVRVETESRSTGFSCPVRIGWDVTLSPQPANQGFPCVLPISNGPLMGR